jgi:hypothetical protein
MKPATLVLILTLGASGALGKNEPCGNNAICVSECQDGLYHIVQSSGKSVFGCVVGLAKKRNIDRLGCVDQSGFGSELDSDTKKACSTASGTFCGKYCFISNSDKKKLAAFNDACLNSAGAEVSGTTFGAVATDELPSDCKVPN